MRGIGRFDRQTNATGAVTRCVMRLGGKVTEADDFSRFIEMIDRWLALNLKAKQATVLHSIVV
jgi:hypothetical protein